MCVCVFVCAFYLSAYLSERIRIHYNAYLRINLRLYFVMQFVVWLLCHHYRAHTILVPSSGTFISCKCAFRFYFIPFSLLCSLNIRAHSFLIGIVFLIVALPLQNSLTGSFSFFFSSSSSVNFKCSSKYSLFLNSDFATDKSKIIWQKLNPESQWIGKNLHQ